MTQTNHQLPEYCSWRPDLTAVAVEAFSVPWSYKQTYFFPPFNLVERCLTKIQMETVTSACLIRSSSLANSELVPSMLMKKPIMLPLEEDLFLSPELTPHPLILQGRLPLATWAICRAFQAELLTSCFSPDEVTHIQHTTQPLKNPAYFPTKSSS